MKEPLFHILKISSRAFCGAWVPNDMGHYPRTLRYYEAHKTARHWCPACLAAANDWIKQRDAAREDSLPW
jgi:hypothetical protein